MNIARIDDTNTVINIEVADDDWLSRPDTHQTSDRYVPYTDDNPAHIGLTWDPDTGIFEQPNIPTPPNLTPEGPADDRPDA